MGSKKIELTQASFPANLPDLSSVPTYSSLSSRLTSFAEIPCRSYEGAARQQTEKQDRKAEKAEQNTQH